MKKQPQANTPELIKQLCNNQLPDWDQMAISESIESDPELLKEREKVAGILVNELLQANECIQRALKNGSISIYEAQQLINADAIERYELTKDLRASVYDSAGE
jgi:hypothetical protein